MQNYKDLLVHILTSGVAQETRTGINTLMIPGYMLQYDLTKGFPAVTTKKLAFRSVVGELLGFLRGYSSAADFRKLGCKIWDQNANENESWLANPHRKGEDDLGYMYSRLWNEMPGVEGWNQIDKLLEQIKEDPSSRRLIVSGWHPEVFDKAALPPCHVLWQVIIEQKTKKMHMTVYQRSCDTFLGVPFNIASYSLLLSLIATVTGYIPGTLTWFGADVHIYFNHIEQVREQLQRTCYDLPDLKLHGITQGTDLRSIEPDQIELINYECHSAIKADMAV